MSRLIDTSDNGSVIQIRMFKVEKTDIIKKWKEWGFEFGQEWLNNASSIEIKNFMENLPDLVLSGQPWPNNEVANIYFSNYKPHPVWGHDSTVAFWRGLFMAVWNFGKNCINPIQRIYSIIIIGGDTYDLET